MENQKFFRKLSFTTVDGKRVDWDMSYMCEKNTGKVYIFEYDTTLTNIPGEFSIPLVDSGNSSEGIFRTMKSISYKTIKDDIAQQVTNNFGESVGSIVEKNGIIYINETPQ